MEKSDIHKRISQADPERLSGYIDMFDRLLLYNVAAATIPPKAIGGILEKWEGAIKSIIDNESQLRTNFLESTPQGRLARKQNQPDGEAMRLLFLSTLSTAKEIVSRNLQRDNEGDEHGFAENDFD